jgi:hypothetical protein
MRWSAPQAKGTALWTSVGNDISHVDLVELVTAGAKLLSSAIDIQETSLEDFQQSQPNYRRFQKIDNVALG